MRIVLLAVAGLALLAYANARLLHLAKISQPDCVADHGSYAAAQRSC